MARHVARAHVDGDDIGYSRDRYQDPGEPTRPARHRPSDATHDQHADEHDPQRRREKERLDGYRNIGFAAAGGLGRGVEQHQDVEDAGRQQRQQADRP